jgi:hypothetical protein
MRFDGSYPFDRPETGTTTGRRPPTVVVVPFVAPEALLALEDDEPHPARITATAHDATTIRRLERAAMGQA